MASRNAQQNLRKRAEVSASVPIMRCLTAARVAYEAVESNYDHFANNFAAKILKIQHDMPKIQHDMPLGTLFPVIDEEWFQVTREMRNRGFEGGVLVYSAEMRNKCEHDGFEVVLHAN